MKNSIKYILLVIVIAGLGYYATTLKSKTDDTPTEAYTDFEVKDTASVYTIKISDTEENEIKLQWNSSDVDNDALTYDVYFGESNPPEIKVSDHTTKELTVQVEKDRVYYWRIIVKDIKDGVTKGQIWSFRS